ncbi:hypothetical protein GOV06_04535 [Candidatus Woesearchaeota archaeon]|nr:hypothetical protein [Candidatus Woesearchaeota archaeon]
MMKLKKFLLIMCIFLIILASAVTAARTVNYQFREATISSQGVISYSNTPVTDVSAIGFVCSDRNCESVSGTLWGGAVQNSGALSTMQLVYPTALQSLDGYGIYYYKPGYITWEANPTWWGTSGNDPQGPYDIYVGKAESCNAPVDTFTILNDVQPNVPVVIDIETSLDATIYAALHHAGPLKYVPGALSRDYYSVATRVDLEITKANERVMKETRVIYIPFSGSERTEFTWIPEVEGDYKATVTTYVIDEKCLSSQEQAATSWFSVIEEDPINMCYTLLNDLAVSNQFPTPGETITITANKISNYADEIYDLESIPTDIELTITDRATGAEVLSQSVTIGANANTVDVQGISFDWTIPDVVGWYDIVMHAVANDVLCTNRIENLDETERIGVHVQNMPNDAPTLAGIPDQYLDENQAPPGNWIDLWQYASDGQTADRDLQFNIVSQSDSSLIWCQITGDRYVNCNTPRYNTYGYTDVTIEVTDGGLWDRDTFRINVNRVNDYPIISNIPNVRFEINGEISLDLDHYTHDPDNTNDELTWTWTGNDNVNVEFDPIKHIVTFTGERHWFGEERLTFTVTDPSGLSDTDVCIVYIDIPKPENDDIMIARIRHTDYMSPGSMLAMNIGLESNTYEDLEDLRVTAVIQDLGIRAASETFDLDGREELSKEIYMEIPEWAAPGYYDIRITISNDYLRRIIHRDVRII